MCFISVWSTPDSRCSFEWFIEWRMKKSKTAVASSDILDSNDCCPYAYVVCFSFFLFIKIHKPRTHLKTFFHPKSTFRAFEVEFKKKTEFSFVSEIYLLSFRLHCAHGTWLQAVKYCGQHIILQRKRNRNKNVNKMVKKMTNAEGEKRGKKLFET